MSAFFQNWWKGMRYEPQDPRFLAGGEIKIVAIGGGTGLSTLLRGLKKYSNQITAIVAVTDDGKSSGLIRKEFDILPPGDIRKCISALAKDEKLISGVLEYRFNKKGSFLSGHTLGNIWIAVLSKYFGSFLKAIEATTEIFATAGKVLPATLSKTELCATYSDGKTTEGESKISRHGKRIIKVFMKNPSTGAYSKAVIAIKNADLIVFGPGSLYTSVMPNLLIFGIAKAIKENAKSLNIFVCNCSTERGETEHYTVKDHIQAVIDHIGGNPFDFCLVNKKIVKTSKNASILGNINNITTKEKEILGCRIIQSDSVDNKNPLYHDSEKLAKALIELYNRTRNQRLVN
jgi:uncharacterized cofD-like protein